MKKLLIIGAGGLGREVFEWASAIPSQARDWEIAGFLDGNVGALNRFAFSYPVKVVGDPQTHQPAPDEVFVCAIGDPGTKLRLAQALQARGAQFITLIHPSATVGQFNQIGEGCIICPGCVVTTNVTLGDFVTLNPLCTVSHDSHIGRGSNLSAHCDVTGFATLGEGVFLGSHASILPSARVGDWAVVGAGAVVLREVPPGTTVIGVPARELVKSTKPTLQNSDS